MMPRNLMLHFAHAELLETMKRAGDAKQVYRALIERLEDPPAVTLATIQLLRFVQRSEGPGLMRREFVVAVQRGRCTFHLVMAAASIDNLVNANPAASLRILMLGVERYGTEPEFLECVVKQFMYLGADKQALQVATQADAVLAPRKRLEMYELLYSHLLFKRDLEEQRNEVERRLLELNPDESPETMELRRFFLPKGFGGPGRR